MFRKTPDIDPGLPNSGEFYNAQGQRVVQQALGGVVLSAGTYNQVLERIPSVFYVPSTTARSTSMQHFRKSHNGFSDNF
jgi:hypothetical protein